MPKQKTEAAEADTELEGREDDNEAAEDDAAVTEASADYEASGVVCGRCGKPFTDDQLERGVECTHWRCPIN